MIGLAIGAAVVGLFVLKRRRWHRHHGHWRAWHGHHGHHGHHPGPWYVMASLDTSPAQEKVIREELGRLRDRGRVAKDDVIAARGELAEIVRGDVFDRPRFDAALGRVDAAWAQLKTSVADSVARIHDTLDSRQRDKLADLLARGPRGGGGPSFGPFR